MLQVRNSRISRISTASFKWPYNVQLGGVERAKYNLLRPVVGFLPDGLNVYNMFSALVKSDT